MKNYNFDELCQFAIKNPLSFKEKFNHEKYIYQNRGIGNETLLHFLSVENHVETAKTLIQMGFDVNCRNSDGDTPLADCVALEHMGMIDILLKAGADPNIQNSMGDTSLHIACEIPYDGKSKKSIVSLLLISGADSNIQNNLGETALHIASGILDKKLKQDIISLLLKSGANPNVENNWGFKALRE